MKFRIAVNRNDCRGWVLNDPDMSIDKGYTSFAAASGDCATLRTQNDSWEYRVIGIDF